jgi:thioredoxin-related protein
VNWRADWEAAQVEARKTGRHLLLELYMETCPHCQRLHRETHSDAAVVSHLSEHFIAVRIEGRSRMDLVQKLNVTGAPTTLIFSAEGKELHRFAGFLPPREYLLELKRFA